VPGRLLRVHQAPRRSRVYAELLVGGVDLIGCRKLDGDRRLLVKALATIADREGNR
jgi:hypothetical protein